MRQYAQGYLTRRNVRSSGCCPRRISGLTAHAADLYMGSLPPSNQPVRAQIEPEPSHEPSGGPRKVWGLGDDTCQSYGRNTVLCCNVWSTTAAAASDYTRQRQTSSRQHQTTKQVP